MFTKSFQIVLASSLLLTLASCGNDSKKSASAQREENPVTSYSWKLVNSKGFPAHGKAMVEVGTIGNTEVIVNECNDKNANHIDRTTTPESLSFAGDAPAGETVTVKIFDCHTMDMKMDATVGFTMKKTGTVGEVVISL